MNEMKTPGGIVVRDGLTTDGADARSPLTDHQQLRYDQIMKWIERRDPRGRDAKPFYEKPEFEVSEEMRELMRGENPDDFFVLTGYAGTGKTYMVSKLIVDLSAMGFMIACGAPTNKAVGVIQEKVREYAGNRVIASTFASVHSFTGLRLIETDDGETKVAPSGYAKLHEYDIFIVDEASMVDTFHQFRAIMENRSKCLVLFIGDPAQLPPVNEGDVSPVFRLPQRAELTEITRQAAGNPLIAASQEVRFMMDRGDATEVSNLMDWLPDSMVRGGSGELERLIVDYQRQKTDTRGVSYTNRAVLSINESVHLELYPDSKLAFSEGERVICQAACQAIDHETGELVELTNSEELVILEVQRATHPYYPDTKVYEMALQDDLGNICIGYVPYHVPQYMAQCSKLFERVREANAANQHERTKELRKAAWAYKKAFMPLRQTYCMTSHKMQGSTTDNVIIALRDIMSIRDVFSYNRSLYVAMTRPRFEAKFIY